MKLYHGSKYKFDSIKRRQAKSGDGVVVPEEELQNAIYFSPNYVFALAMCSMPKGLSNVDWDNMTIKTEFLEKFNPDMPVYIYEVDSEKIPSDKITILDDMQTMADIDEIKYDSIVETTASEVLKYYKLLN